jgi:hypothetical protein
MFLNAKCRKLKVECNPVITESPQVSERLSLVPPMALLLIISKYLSNKKSKAEI